MNSSYDLLENNAIVGLDIGTTKISCIIAQDNDQGGLEIIGVGISPSNGLKKGVVINIENTMKSVAKAIGDAEIMAAVEPDKVITGIAGGHIESANYKGVVAVTDNNRIINEQDVRRVIDQSQKVNTNIDREILHVMPIEFIVDDQDGIPDPTGMSGARLEAKVHVISGNVSSVQNIVRSVEMAGYGIEDIVLEPLASAEAVLSEEEKNLGCVLVDVGGGTSDICIFIDGSVRFSHVLSIGGFHVTKDLAIGLRTQMKTAEEVKIAHGCAHERLIDQNEMVDVAGVEGRAGRQVSKRDLCKIIQPRIEELVELVKMKIDESGLSGRFGAGVVLTGGASQLTGFAEVAEDILALPVRIGSPRNITGLADQVCDPKFATGVGLVLFGKKKGLGGNRQSHGGIHSGNTDERTFRNLTRKMKGWIHDFF